MKSILLTLATFLSIFSITAQDLEKSTLWKISGNTLEKPSYLFGTIHLTCNASFDEDVKKALDDTTQIVLEIDMDDPGLQQKMMGNMFMKNGKTLNDFVSEEDYKTLETFFLEYLGMPLKTMLNIKPFFLSTMLYPKMLDCPIQSYELELVKIAKTQDEDIKGLETIEDQLKVFDTIPYQDQINDLLKTAKDKLKYDKENFAKMLELYSDEDISELLKMVVEDKNNSFGKYQDVFLNNRNKNWISKIKSLATDQPTFFAVGAGHLAGEEGVINLLRKAGFTITAI
ncbi:TraB/GumN family protein [Hyunsoonleella sp. 2307UL5-6]|uniref:TraB/GumN family protein n=1 Tax=Hyunsoonleella sp. 2307UL5-6 TaxID=3384768 RepID=UPI0039BD6247